MERNEKRKIIMAEFFRTELLPGEKIVDNSDLTISRKTGFTLPLVQFMISQALKEREVLLDKRCEETRARFRKRQELSMKQATIFLRKREARRRNTDKV
jgi:hypothetical protein